jgi:glycine/sarcosine N-methyltransferase
MAHKTDPDSRTAEIIGFYDRIAPAYDAMTSMAGRMEREQPLYARLVAEYGIRTAVDAGCGTGVHALLLARQGVRVTAVDCSAAMLARLMEHAAAEGRDVRTIQAGLEDLSTLLSGPFDAILSTGNTLPHLPDIPALDRCLSGFARLLRPGGIIFLQLLNYERILSRRERMQSVREEGGEIFVRFYDFLDPLLRFNILRLEKTGEGFRPELSSVTLRPFLESEIRRALAPAGFIDIRTFGDLSMNPFDPANSPDLFLLARRR